MRRIIMFNNVAADGCFSANDGSLAWVVQDGQLQSENAAAAASHAASTVLFGRRTYEMFASFWPHVRAGVPAPHGRGPISPEMLAMGNMLNAAEKLVFSTTLKDASWTNTRILPRVDPHEVEALKRAAGPDIMLFGSGSIVTQLTQHRLIDEYQLVVSPIVLGSAKPLFGALPAAVPLRLLDAKAYPTTGVARLRYAPAKP